MTYVLWMAQIGIYWCCLYYLYNFNFQLINHAIMKIKFFSFFSLPKYTLIHVEHIVKNRRYTTLIIYYFVHNTVIYLFVVKNYSNNSNYADEFS